MTKAWRTFRFWCVLPLAWWALTLTATAQVELIPETPMSMDGALSVGYAGGSGNGSDTGSNSIDVGVNANLVGYFHDPRFLSFDVAPRYTWDHFGSENAAGASLRNDGLSSSFRFLGSSNTPLTFLYSVSNVNSTTLTGGTVPLSVSASGLSNDYSLNWAPHFAGWPATSLTYSWGSSDSNATGTGNEFLNSHSTLSVVSMYRRWGFYLTGFYSRTESESQTPDVLNLGVPQNTGQSNQQSEGFSVDRPLKSLRGEINFSYNHSDSEFSVLGSPSSENYESMGASLSTNPTPRLQMGFDAAYSSNYGAQLLTQVLAPLAGGTTTPSQSFLGTGRDTSYDGTATYQIGLGFFLSAVGGQQTSDEPGQEQIVVNQGSAGLSYRRVLFRGMFSASYSPGIEQLSYSVAGASFSSLAFTQAGAVSYLRRFGRWQTQEGFQYSHANFSEGSLALPMVVESVSGSARIGTRLRYHWNLSLGGSLSDQRVPGMNNSLNTELDAQLLTRSWSATGQYQRNDGYVLLTTGGIVGVSSVTAAATGVPTQYTDSTGLAFSGSYTRRHLQLQGTYDWVNVDFTGTSGSVVTTKDSTFDARLIYKFRKIDLQAGFRRLSQYATSNTGLNIASDTYWMSLVRRFHAF